MKVGIDLGYNAVKVVSDSGNKTFPSMVGTPEQSSYGMGGRTTFTITHEDKMYNVGEAAIEQSRFAGRQEDREWINSTEYMILFLAALSTQRTSGSVDMSIVTGLPLAYFEADRESVQERFEKVHHVYRDDRKVLTVNVRHCWVAPQPMGTLASMAFTKKGDIANADIARGRVGIIDIGGHTTNILHSLKMEDIRAETESIVMGGWHIARAMQPVIEERCPGVDWKSHEIEQAIKNKSINYRGDTIDLSDDVNTVLNQFANPILAKVRELWPGDGARLDCILITGGGAHLIGNRIKSDLKHSKVSIIDDPVFANAIGYHRLVSVGEKK